MNTAWGQCHKILCHDNLLPFHGNTVILRYKQRYYNYNSNYHVITCTRSFDMGLTSAEGLRLECFNLTVNNTFIINIKIKQTHFVVHVKLCQHWLSVSKTDFGTVVKYSCQISS